MFYLLAIRLKYHATFIVFYMSHFLLAIETSTEFCSVALTNTQRTWLKHESLGLRTSACVLPFIQTLLDEADVHLENLSAIAFGAGPGAFTGLRNACALAQGLAFGLGIPLIAVDTLMACAELVRREEGREELLVAIDARMGEVYWAEYRYEGSRWRTLMAPQLTVPGAIYTIQTDCCWAGNACTIFSDILSERALHQFPLAMPRADCVAYLGLAQLSAGDITSPEKARPHYVRNKVALTTVERQIFAHTSGRSI